MENQQCMENLTFSINSKQIARLQQTTLTGLRKDNAIKNMQKKFAIQAILK